MQNPYKDKINQLLEQFLTKKLEQDGKYSPHTKELISNIREYTMRSAKRIRPLVAIFAYKCFKDDEKIVFPSISLELIQSYLLIHDDIMDRSDLRRGKPTMHKIYSYPDEHFGISTAILAGNVCASYMYETILESEFSNKEKNAAIAALCWINDRENYGQALDIIPGFTNLTEEGILKLQELKTATYTVQGPIMFGCALAGAPKKVSKKLQEYALNIGLAFQLQDDLNGIFGPVEEIGKPNDSDIKEGKKTLIILKALELATPENKQYLIDNYGKQDLTSEQVGRIRFIIDGCGAKDACKKRLSEFVDAGKKALEGLELREEGKNSLLEMADYILSLFK